MGGHQEDAEEFLGFYLNTLEEELLTLSSSLTNPNQAPTQQNNNAPANNVQEEGWLEGQPSTQPNKSTSTPSLRSSSSRSCCCRRQPCTVTWTLCIGFLSPHMIYTSGVILDATNKDTSLENSKDTSRYYTIAATLVQ
ncbi:hypothetical protein DEU56DRAFT_758099 [Suillus clintonianus]|uniref:uncharacterized protein n=1 Tax=Suillus clintonianus TaxID=1904413 RepID=UPI001B87BC09|nr:uncharacterized protein DEU56DRAFT_758099 [Suillus clintonianus]KAG2129600.1 hypothetical protein DEU56DRAFT_758099 [Suillus clintonianus]